MYNVIFNSGAIGLLIWILLFASATAATAVIIRCLWILRQGAFLPRKFKDAIAGLINSGDFQGVFDLCSKSHGLAAEVIGRLLVSAHELAPNARQELAVELIERRGRTVLRQINTLAMCGNIAPMLGLLGTVTGMVDAFLGLGTALGPEKTSVLAISISQALYTTAAGLLVAVPAIVFSLVLRNLLEKRLELVSDCVENVLKRIGSADDAASEAANGKS